MQVELMPGAAPYIDGSIALLHGCGAMQLNQPVGNENHVLTSHLGLEGRDGIGDMRQRLIEKRPWTALGVFLDC
jgi:hypothetical protein